ncbi:GtrA family protein [Paenibacillus sp. FSL H7-0331]|uniref:GtrA family protein n=1 Tax=Paenibacillus sp. FSL H7-0331 TaxID=1920421 RepID=UPI00096F4DBD|nr:GtrA family protein [Paenibacillus sp. FSL H7-0331]OMF08581.1 hypothetical protein BK127_28335 [Paenibacillus sp. FSL H7-0331]
MKKGVITFIPRFLVSGFSAVGTDSLVYITMLSVVSPSIAKTASFLCGTIIAYLLNKYWTFQIKSKSYKEIMKFVILYLSTLSINVVLNNGLLLIFKEYYWLAFLGATGTSTVLNFIGQKWWVFKNDKTVYRNTLL